MPTTVVPLQGLAQRIREQEAQLAELRQELEARNSQLSDLLSRREALQAELMKLDTEIQEVGHVGIGASAPTRKRGRPAAAVADIEGLSLPKLIVHLVSAAGGPMSAEEIVQAVIDSGYKSSSKNFAGMVETRISELVRHGLLQRTEDETGVALPAEPKRKGRRGGKRGRRRRGGKAARAKANGAPKRQTLRQKVVELLAASDEPLSAAELAQRALADGYKTRSANLTNVIWAAISKWKEIERIDGSYRLKKE